MKHKEELTDALAYCLNGLERNEMSFQECLDLYPQHREELFSLLEKFEVVRSLPLETARSEFRKKGYQALLNAIKTRQPEAYSDRVQRALRGLVVRKPRKYSPVKVLAAVVLAFVSVTGGVAFASDAAAPGDMLYGLDRAIERIRLHMAADVEDAIALRLGFAEERLQEVEDRISADDMDDAQEALDYYDLEINALAELVVSPDGSTELADTELIDAALKKNNEVLLRVLEKVPEQAKKAIQNAIDSQEKVRGYLKDHGKPEKPDKPDKPEKTHKPEKTDQPEGPESQDPDETP